MKAAIYARVSDGRQQDGPMVNLKNMEEFDRQVQDVLDNHITEQLKAMYTGYSQPALLAAYLATVLWILDGYPDRDAAPDFLTALEWNVAQGLNSLKETTAEVFKAMAENPELRAKKGPVH